MNKRGKNLGDVILKRKQFALEASEESSGSIRCTPKCQPGVPKASPGRDCESCELMSSIKTITSRVTGKSYRAPSGNCKSRNVIYGAQCIICLKQYVGKTMCKLRTRISGHRTHISRIKEEQDDDDDKDEAALANHLIKDHNLKTPEWFNKCYSFAVLQDNPSDIDRAEQIWVNRLVTMRPFGLNIEKPCGVSDQLHRMSLKAQR